MKILQIPKAILAVVVVLATNHLAFAEPLHVDFRYQPYTWQSLICMPCDPIKTLVGKDGVMFNVDDIKLIPLPAANAKWLSQELAAPRVPIVLTHRRAGDLEITEEAFVSPIAADAARVKSPFAQRIGNRETINNWAAPTLPCEPAFRDAAAICKGPVHYRFRARKDSFTRSCADSAKGRTTNPATAS